MSFDPEGTQPGLVAAQPTEKTLHMSCRKDSCDSIQVTEISPSTSVENSGAPHSRIYRCVKCGTTWNSSVGGYVNL